MPEALSWDLPLGRGRWARARGSTTALGDLAVGAPPGELAERRRRLADLPWAWLRQEHGAAVAVVGGPTGAAAVAGATGDALVTASPGVALGVQAADCAPVALASADGVVGAVHAGWRGVEAGVLEAAVAAMADLGAGSVQAALFPCIGPCCNDFGPAELDRVAARCGPSVRSWSRAGRPALDLPAAVAAALGRVGVGVVEVVPGACTACDPARRWYSHRGRGDAARHALAVWVA